VASVTLTEGLAPGAQTVTASYLGHDFLMASQEAEPLEVLRTRLDVVAPVGGSVPATLSLTLGAPATLGAFTPGLTKEYSASTTASVISTAGDAALSVSDPGFLTNGTFVLPEPLRVEITPSTWSAPVSNAAVAIAFKQLVKATDALRTGAYSKTLTFTLSTTIP
jgi:hypothetical protein